MKIFEGVTAGLESAVGFMRDAVGVGPGYKARHDDWLASQEVYDPDIELLAKKARYLSEIAFLEFIERVSVTYEEVRSIGHVASVAAPVDELQTAGR